MRELFEVNVNDISVLGLCEKDPKLAKLIQVVGSFSFPLDENYFEALVKKIIGQQLSVKAAGTIWSRVEVLCGKIEPEILTQITDEEFRSVGVSRPKISYIRDLTGKVVNGELDLSVLASYEDREVLESLTRVKGIGKWSAEMFLIFSLGRQDTFSYLDVGLRRGIKWLYKIEDSDIASFPKIEQWAPNRTIASLYLWEIVNRGYIYDYSDIEALYTEKKLANRGDLDVQY